MNQHHSINYVEFPASDIPASKAFFGQVFGWQFEDYGPNYCAFSNAGLDGGFFASNQHSRTANGATLVVFYSNNLEATQAAIEQAGGTVCKPIFAFPGGRRFHFLEPGGNELAVWSDVE